MNLHGIVAGAIGAVNPLRQATLMRSIGYTINPDGTQVPAYQTIGNVTCQVQELTSKDLHQLDGLNLQGSSRAVYLNGDWSGVVRATSQGGDMVQLDDGTIWLVVAIPEKFPDWTKMIITLQDGS